MTVKELKEELNKFDDNLVVTIQLRGDDCCWTFNDVIKKTKRTSIDGDGTTFSSGIYPRENGKNQEIVIIRNKRGKK
jgi:hypothetical protein